MSGTVSEELKQHAHATPAVKASNRGYVGAFLLSGSGYLFVADDFASYPEDLKIARGSGGCRSACCCFGRLCGSHNRREPLAAFFAIAEAVGLFLAVHSWAPQLLDYAYVQGFSRRSAAPIWCGWTWQYAAPAAMPASWSPKISASANGSGDDLARRSVRLRPRE